MKMIQSDITGMLKTILGWVVRDSLTEVGTFKLSPK